MQNNKEKLEDFKTAISSTVKSISNSQKVEISFGNEISDTNKYTIKLPNIESVSNKINFEEIRAAADSKSLRHRFSNNETFKKFEPEGNISKKLYDISEKIRCERIGTSYFKGVKNNIENFYQKRIAELDLKSIQLKIIFRKSDNPYEGKKNKLSERQVKKRKRLIKHIKKSKK